MGQQQLLLIVLGVIIVGIAIAVGISMFKSNATTSNRDQLINDLNNLAAKSQQFYRKPSAMAGGGQTFTGFKLDSIDVANGNGYYQPTATQPTGATPWGSYATVSTDTVTINTANLQTLYIQGVGVETGRDGQNPVKAYVTVTNNAIVAAVLN